MRQACLIMNSESERDPTIVTPTDDIWDVRYILRIDPSLANHILPGFDWPPPESWGSADSNITNYCDEQENTRKDFDSFPLGSVIAAWFAAKGSGALNVNDLADEDSDAIRDLENHIRSEFKSYCYDHGDSNGERSAEHNNNKDLGTRMHFYVELSTSANAVLSGNNEILLANSCVTL
ncbi:hypothetical protein ABW19_dt0202170 [Dactylella cylindrospora]|nr:hypothetical protein ABW19_dt0202170 [Dactylella cylindrospora]